MGIYESPKFAILSNSIFQSMVCFHIGVNSSSTYSDLRKSLIRSESAAVGTNIVVVVVRRLLVQNSPIFGNFGILRRLFRVGGSMKRVRSLGVVRPVSTGL